MSRSTVALWVAAASSATVGAVILMGAPPPDRPATPQPTALQTPAPTSKPTGDGSTAPPTGTAPPSPSPSSSPTAMPSSPSSQPAAAPWEPTARGFAQDFTNTTGGHPAWVRRLQRWTSSYLAQQYQYTDIRTVPIAALTELTPLSVSTRRADVLASYDSGLNLTCRVELTSHGWKVINAEPADTAGGGD